MEITKKEVKLFTAFLTTTHILSNEKFKNIPKKYYEKELYQELYEITIYVYYKLYFAIGILQNQERIKANRIKTI
jgi:hypothetical protein